MEVAHLGIQDTAHRRRRARLEVGQLRLEGTDGHRRRAKLLEDLRRREDEHRQQEVRDGIEALEDGAHDGKTSRVPILHLPRLSVGEELVCRVEGLDCEVGRALEAVRRVRLLGLIAESREVKAFDGLGGHIRHLAVIVLAAEGERAVDEVAVRVGEVRIVRERERRLGALDVITKLALLVVCGMREDVMEGW